MRTNSERIVGASGRPHALRGLFDVAATRQLERAHAASVSHGDLMELAGEATGKLALAIAPHARDFWIACGPGNNGGDGFQAARFLKQQGKNPIITYLAEGTPSGDALAAHEAAQHAGIAWSDQLPQTFDACIDALFGIGQLRPFSATHCRWIEVMNSSVCPVLSVDVPSGLDADTGSASKLHVRASHTLSLLTLKPGLFTAYGRDACGEIWLNDLGLVPACAPVARLIAHPKNRERLHSSHKGSYGDVAVVGGARGMGGAAVLAGRAALHGGAGRVLVCLLDAQRTGHDGSQPELMFRDFDQIDWAATTWVVGCGGGDAIGQHLHDILRKADRLVLDADALNQIAAQPELQALLAARNPAATVITPHPLEAARLMETSTAAVQSNRLHTAQTLAQKFHCTVVLKGSGTVITAPGAVPAINTTGNGLLATAGTGDVLAGLIGARMAGGQSALDAACDSVYLHGQVANNWTRHTLTASALSQAL